MVEMRILFLSFTVIISKSSRIIFINILLHLNLAKLIILNLKESSLRPLLQSRPLLNIQKLSELKLD